MVWLFLASHMEIVASKVTHLVDAYQQKVQPKNLTQHISNPHGLTFWSPPCQIKSEKKTNCTTYYGVGGLVAPDWAGECGWPHWPFWLLCEGGGISPYFACGFEKADNLHPSLELNQIEHPLHCQQCITQFWHAGPSKGGMWVMVVWLWMIVSGGGDFVLFLA